MDATCYHMGGPLLHADIEDLDGFGPAIVCPWHRYQISLRNGDGLYVNMSRQTCSKGARQRVHAVERRDGLIYVHVAPQGEGAESRVESDTYAFKKPAPSGPAQQPPPGRSGQVLARPGAAGTRGIPARDLAYGCSGGCASVPLNGSVSADVARSMAGADGRAPWAASRASSSAPRAVSLASGLKAFRMPSFGRAGAAASPPEGWAVATVVATKPVGRATVQLSLRGSLPGADPSVWERGAHLHVRLSTAGEERPYTPFVLPGKRGQFELVVKSYPHGTLSPALAATKPGSTLFVHGPLSGSAGVRADTALLVLVAGGTGITPLLQLLLPLTARAAAGASPLLAVRMLCFNRSEKDVLLRDELCQLATTHPQLHVLHCLTEPSAGWSGLTGRPSAPLLKKALPQLGAEKAQLFHCGPPLFNDAVRSALAELGWPDAVVHEFA